MKSVMRTILACVLATGCDLTDIVDVEGDGDEPGSTSNGNSGHGTSTSGQPPSSGALDSSSSAATVTSSQATSTSSGTGSTSSSGASSSSTSVVSGGYVVAMAGVPGLEFYRVNGFGSQALERLDNQPAFGRPAWSPTGNRVAYTGLVDDGYSDGYYHHHYEALIRDREQNQTTSAFEGVLPDWSADGKKLAGFNESWELVIHDLDRGTSDTLPTPSSFFGMSTPRWDPSTPSSYVAYQWMGFSGHLAVVQTDSTAGWSREVDGDVAGFAWAPTGSMLTYSAARVRDYYTGESWQCGGDYYEACLCDILQAPATSGEPVPLVRDTRCATELAWSPDGRYLAYGDDDSLYYVSVSGSLPIGGEALHASVEMPAGWSVTALE